MDDPQFSDFSSSGNAAVDPDLYDIKNRAVDPEGLVVEVMRKLAPWAGATLVDLGCGTGYWFAAYADEAAEVIGVEPDPSLLQRARRSNPAARVLAGSAEHLPLPDGSVDVVHARFAYFFPPGCDAGLAEVLWVLKPEGRLVVVDDDQRHGEFANLLAASILAAPQGRAETTDQWWEERGAERREVMSEWRFDSRKDFGAVLRMEFPAAVADHWLSGQPTATGLSYGYVLFSLGRRTSRPDGRGFTSWRAASTTGRFRLCSAEMNSWSSNLDRAWSSAVASE
jgi:SAM-dependent methyltransferase